MMTLCDELTLCRNTLVKYNWEAHVRTGVGRAARAVTSGWLSGGCVERSYVHATRTTMAGCVCHVDAWIDGSKSYWVRHCAPGARTGVRVWYRRAIVGWSAVDRQACGPAVAGRACRAWSDRAETGRTVHAVGVARAGAGGT